MNNYSHFIWYHNKVKNWKFQLMNSAFGRSDVAYSSQFLSIIVLGWLVPYCNMVFTIFFDNSTAIYFKMLKNTTVGYVTTKPFYHLINFLKRWHQLLLLVLVPFTTIPQGLFTRVQPFKNTNIVNQINIIWRVYF